jgi:hypothetical protein
MNQVSRHFILFISSTLLCVTTSHAQEQRLLEAAIEGDAEEVTSLVQNGTNVDASLADGATALMLAAQQGHADVVRILLEHDAEVDSHRADGATALIQAAQNGHPAVTRILLEHGADVDSSPAGGVTALWIASQNGHTDVVHALLEHGANVDASRGDGWNALSQASLNGHAETVRILLEHGADVAATTDDGLTALHIVQRSAHITDSTTRAAIIEMLSRASSLHPAGELIYSPFQPNTIVSGFEVLRFEVMNRYVSVGPSGDSTSYSPIGPINEIEYMNIAVIEFKEHIPNADIELTDENGHNILRDQMFMTKTGFLARSSAVRSPVRSRSMSGGSSIYTYIANVYNLSGLIILGIGGGDQRVSIAMER